MGAATSPDAVRAQRERAKRALESLKHTGALARQGSLSGSERSDQCFDWSRGSCARGESCRFAHDGTPGGNVNASGGRTGSPHRVAAGVCFDHAKGTCKRGDQCRFSHDVAAVAAFAKIASASGSPTSSPTNGRVGTVNIPKPLPIAGALSAALRPMVKAEPAPAPAPIVQRSGAIDYASAAKAGVVGAAEGSFAAALVGKKMPSGDNVATAGVPTASPPPPAVEKHPALTASGASVPAPRFPAPNGGVTAGVPAVPVMGDANGLPKPSYQFGTGSMVAGDYATEDRAGQGANGSSLGSRSAPKQYPKPEFAFGSGATGTPLETNAVPVANESFVPPVPAGPPPEANQRPQATPGFGFGQPGFGLAQPEKAAPHANFWGGHAQSPTNGVVVQNGAGADGSSQLGSEWDMSGMGMEGLVEDYSKLGTYDALGGNSPFSVGLGYSLFSPAVSQQQDGAGYQQQGQSQPASNLWGSSSSFSGAGW
ncbi:Zinc finger, CCCH-type [Ostreococcus tauri]|uniref:Zinc finger, CCCH-type n=1 Tax=Ostreococcus tauri TaxID=70448 RepID=A0A090M106_OSTTA|nr:Zinc finger, CCCH-type [Ostreococcus tauri]CEF97900.1 Zinc finger, CCCH-type [Ostreococcus tauri]|eukprot:XP_003079229.2 Zinc finger, CCCH-type [Ostreococcus tauri]